MTMRISRIIYGALSRASRGSVAGVALAGLSLSVIAVVDQAGIAQTPPPARPPGPADPVNLYVPANPSPSQDGEVQARHILGRVWLMTGQPGESNVLVQLGDQGALIVDTGTQAMAPKLLARIQQLMREQDVKSVIRKVINTNGRLDHIGGNDVIRKAGSQIIGGEEAAQQRLLGEVGATRMC
jgi:glyoxylase-like metal-dependent hydrolase (beta-lactamase superfamily II)